MMTGEGFVLAYSLVDLPTFEEVQQLRTQIMKIKGNTRVPMVLMGNKLDLVQREPNRRAVSHSVAQQLADSWGVPLFETSAKGTHLPHHHLFSPSTQSIHFLLYRRHQCGELLERSRKTNSKGHRQARSYRRRVAKLGARHRRL